MSFNPGFLNNFLLIATALGAAFLAALWLSLIVWTYRDSRNRVRDPLVRILAALLVAVLFLPGIVVYLILRPPQTMEEEYQHMLEEEALLQAIEERTACPGCGRHTAEDWIICPNCYTKLMKPCHACGRLMKLPWSLCPYCGTPEPGKRIEDLTVAEAARSVEIEDDEVEGVGEMESEVAADFEGEDTLDLGEFSDEDMISKL
ncbi:MAG: double zinc ribbon domain-containing protein [Anaerolineales bacterium]